MVDKLVWMNESFGAVIKSERESLGWTINEVAKRCGTKNISAMYISQLERGVRVPSDEKVTLLATALGLNPHRLVLSARFEKSSPEIRKLVFGNVDLSAFIPNPFLELAQLAESLPEKYKKHWLIICKLQLELMCTIVEYENSKS